ncbi:SecY-interacting protein Syd, partial [Pantoea septica]
MMQQTVDALREFTARYYDAWQQRTGHAPASQALYGVPSPCIIATQADEVWWQPQPFTLPATLEAVERALEITLQEDIAAFYTTQFAGDMTARCAHLELSLLQVW